MKLAAFIVVGCVVIAVAWWVTPDIPRLDDGFISLQSAQSVVAGRDPHYGNPPLTGVTSPPYVLLLASLLAVGLSPLAALKVGTALGLVALMVSLWLLGRALNLSPWLRLVLPIAVLVGGPIAQQATNGVETGWAMAAGVALIAFAVRKQRVAAAITAGCLPWLRPDLVPMAALLFLWSIWKAPRREVLLATVAAVCAFLPWAIWLYADTGAWVPQSMSAKTAFAPEWCLPAGAKVGIATHALRDWFLFFLPMSAFAAIWLLRTPVGRLGVAAILCSVAAYVVIWPSALWFNAQRYLYAIVVPWFSLGVATLLQTTTPLLRAVWAGAILASVFLLPRHQLVWLALAQDRVAAAQWMRDHIDPREVILVQDAGAASVFTQNPLVDFVGLKTPSSIAVHRAITWPSCGADRAKALAAIARSSGARYLFITQEWDRTNALTAGLRSEGFQLEEIRPAPVEDGYEVFRIQER